MTEEGFCYIDHDKPRPNGATETGTAEEARAALPLCSGWLAIDTAPKDGSYLWLTWCGLVTVGRWNHWYKRWDTAIGAGAPVSWSPVVPNPPITSAGSDAKRAGLEDVDKGLREQLAELCHAQWSGWMKFLFSITVTTNPGHVVLSAHCADRWKRQMETAYADLSEAEKESDRKEADRILAVISTRLRAGTADVISGDSRPQPTTTTVVTPAQEPETT